MEELKKGEIRLSDGEVLPALIPCKKCAKKCSQYWNFCPACGVKLAKNKHNV